MGESIVYAGPPPQLDLDQKVDSTGRIPFGVRLENTSQGLGTLAWIWVVVFMAILVVAHFHAEISPTPVSIWTSDLEEGLATARANDQLVLVAFKTTTCPACVQMDHEVLTKATVSRALADWVAVTVHPGYHSRLAAQYGVRAVPTFVILTPEGAVFDSFEGTRDVTSFVGWIDRAERKWRDSRKAGA
jgi:thioredoxin-like negative regulator of GroEL